MTDEYAVLKLTLRSSVSSELGIQIPEDIVYLIFDDFLSKFQWIYPDQHILSSTRLDRNIAQRLADSGDDCVNAWRELGYKVMGRLGLRYVTVAQRGIANNCTFSGIGISIQLNDPSFTKEVYPELFESFDDLGIDLKTMCSIWTERTPKTFWDVLFLYDLIYKYCEDKHDQIEVNAHLLLDHHVDDDDLFMILTEWESISEREFYQAPDRWRFLEAIYDSSSSYEMSPLTSLND